MEGPWKRPSNAMARRRQGRARAEEEDRERGGDDDDRRRAPEPEGDEAVMELGDASCRRSNELKKKKLQ